MNDIEIEITAMEIANRLNAKGGRATGSDLLAEVAKVCPHCRISSAAMTTVPMLSVEEESK